VFEKVARFRRIRQKRETRKITHSWPCNAVQKRYEKKLPNLESENQWLPYRTIFPRKENHLRRH